MTKVFSREWFIKNQKQIVWFANTRYGKRVLKHGLDRVDCITPNAVFKKLENGKIQAEFRTHAKYAKNLYYSYRFLWNVIHWYDLNIANKISPSLNLGFDSLATFYPDANTETTTVDGFAYRTGTESFANLRANAGVGNDSTSASTQPVRFTTAVGSPNFAENRRGIFLFDTSDIAGGVVSSATFSLYVTSEQHQLGGAIGITTSNPASNTDIVNNDYNIANFQDTRLASDIDISSLNTSGYNDWVLNASGIAAVSVDGITKFGVRISFDIDNSAPSWVSNNTSNFTCYFADQTGTSSDPKLVVTYTPKRMSGAILLMMV